MQAEKFLQKYFKEKIKNKSINSLRKIDLISNGVIDSLDIVTLSVMIKKEFKIDININSQKSIDIFRSYDRLLKKINEQK
tara:strand:- start:162 stop:401 length:240 start_codon:yes stop_codon:yes gene_type:complete